MFAPSYNLTSVLPCASARVLRPVDQLVAALHDESRMFWMGAGRRVDLGHRRRGHSGLVADTR